LICLASRWYGLQTQSMTRECFSRLTCLAEYFNKLNVEFENMIVFVLP
jgi:hypothetical protein